MCIYVYMYVYRVLLRLWLFTVFEQQRKRYSHDPCQFKPCAAYYATSNMVYTVTAT